MPERNKRKTACLISDKEKQRGKCIPRCFVIGAYRPSLPLYTKVSMTDIAVNKSPVNRG